MSRTAKTAGAPSPPPGELPFETALHKLEDVVQAMEAEDLPIETLLARYEEGVRLLAECQARLAAAEVKISQLEQNQAGELVVTAWTAPANPAPAAATE